MDGQGYWGSRESIVYGIASGVTVAVGAVATWLLWQIPA